MVSVAPTSDLVNNLTRATSQIPSQSRWIARASKLLRLWKRMQVSYYGGKYSIHRVLALNEYTTNTSLARVLLVFVATPLPMVALVYGQELIPLQALSEGWSANYGMWIRTAVLACVTTHAVVVQATYLIDDFAVSTSQLLLLYLCVPASVVALAAVVAAHFVFPIPFFVLFVAPPFYGLLITSVRIVVGARAMSQMLTHRGQVSRCVRFVCAQTSTVFIFPVYEMLFRAAEGTRYQLPVILLLPVIKVMIKNVVLHYAKSLEDMIPVEVIFTADFFNAVYVATCMQSASSAITVSAITITDLSQTIITLYGMQRRTTSILSRLRRTVQHVADKDNMLTMICILCRNPASFRKQAYTGIRKRSCLPHHISMMSKRVLESLDEIIQEAAAEPVNVQASSEFSVGPRNPSILYPNVFPQPVKNKLSRRHPNLQRSTILLESLETLFTTECLIITAYVEAFMPLFYCSYMLIMVHLNNAQYHTEMKGVTHENVGATILPLFAFGLLQIVAFVLLVVVIKRNCGMEALYQLGFVLETQRSLIQCKMMLWMVITLSFRVIHFGKLHRGIDIGFFSFSWSLG
ncbi:hypothetical protein PHYPSEUDO_003153 [Phytophthora pseudosyringae]|uniref:Transmembrane protein n=1 Tax=Phytophthora pseudosyringae TaxID=221518 RepID=A0A8T1VWP3_9STRA|nr:hypothetical protein PHYPSEUDO_003153 [Phytophthora pseudosyringae]